MASLKVYDVLHQPFIAILVVVAMGWVAMCMTFAVILHFVSPFKTAYNSVQALNRKVKQRIKGKKFDDSLLLWCPIKQGM